MAWVLCGSPATGIALGDGGGGPGEGGNGGGGFAHDGASLRARVAALRRAQDGDGARPRHSWVEPLTPRRQYLVPGTEHC